MPYKIKCLICGTGIRIDEEKDICDDCFLGKYDLCEYEISNRVYGLRGGEVVRALKRAERGEVTTRSQVWLNYFEEKTNENTG